MALSKRTYVGGTTIITAENLNNIQDSIIALEDKGITKDEIITALGYTPAKNGDVSGALPLTGGTMSGSIDMNGKDLSNIGYATFILGGETEGISFNPTGSVENPVLEIMGTNSDEPTILRGVAEPENNSDCATKSYVDGKIPTSLKNPKALKFTGASTETYDGSSEVTINIPSGNSINVKDYVRTSAKAVAEKVLGITGEATATVGTGGSYTNRLPLSIDSSGAIYNTTGYKTGYRLNSSGVEKQITESYYDSTVCVTGFIPCAAGGRDSSIWHGDRSG